MAVDINTEIADKLIMVYDRSLKKINSVCKSVL